MENFTRIRITTITTVSEAATVVVVTAGAGIPTSSMTGMISVEVTEP
jgi:hypothetical protein